LLATSGRLAVLAAEPHDPAGYGRIVRDPEGRVAAIVEQKDADEEQRRIRTVNTGIIAADAVALKQWLARLSNDNAQGEYYLTDVFAMAAAEYTRPTSSCLPTRRRPRVPTTLAAGPA
jgi:bifunctional UDP-N-acetylglucosamine pyrophosphorylase/glucosamine-1-phosphate N-acetyltransferase